MSTRSDVLELLRRSEPMSPSQVSERTGLPRERVKKCMARMARAGELVNEAGTYRVPDAQAGDVPATEPTDNGPRIRILRDEWENPTPTPRRISNVVSILEGSRNA